MTVTGLPTWQLLDHPVIQGDCIAVMAAMPAESVDAVVCDPPYGLEFMGKAWDAFREDDPGTARHRGDRAGNHGDVKADNQSNPAAGRVAYGGGKRPSTSRCVGCGKRDQFRQMHQCPPGTPWRTETLDPHAAPPSMLAFQNWTREWARQALRVLKPGGHLLAFGGTRTYHRLAAGIEDAGFEVRDTLAWMYGSGFPKSLNLNGEYSGWGTALKPAYEPIVIARKPLAGTVAATMRDHGTGALNIDGCRLGTDEQHRDKCASVVGLDSNRNGATYGQWEGAREDSWSPLGRWPANVLLDEQAAAILDEQTGETRSRIGQPRSADAGAGWAMTATGAEYDDQGGASRFFYVAKASTTERSAGLDAFEAAPSMDLPDAEWATTKNPYLTGGATERKNVHPTVKPIDVMRWLIRLVTPPGGIVLDPFTGSGTTGCAAALEARDFVGIERDPDYHAIACARIAWWRTHPEGAHVATVLTGDNTRRKVADTGQTSLLDMFGTPDDHKEVA